MVIPENLVDETTILVLVAVIVILLFQFLSGGSSGKEETDRRVENPPVKKPAAAVDESDDPDAIYSSIPKETDVTVEEPVAPAKETVAALEENVSPAEEPSAAVEEPAAPAKETTAAVEETTAPAEEPAVPAPEKRKREDSGDMASAAAASAVKVARTFVTDKGSKNLSNKEHKQAVIDHFSALEFADMAGVLDELRTTKMNHPMHPAFNVTSRAPTKEEISRSPQKHTFSWQKERMRKKGKDVVKSLLDNPELFQLGVPFHVEFSPFPDGGRDAEATYSGEINFNLFGLPGSLKLGYTARIPKYGDQGYDRIDFKIRFESAACTTTLLDLKNVSYWPDYEGFKWKDPEGEPVLNLKLKEMGFNHDQSKAVVQGLFEKLEPSFKKSGLSYNPCEIYITYLFENEINWGVL